MSDKARKVLGIGGAVLVAGGTVAMVAAGGDAESATGIVGLAAAAFAAVAALVNGLRK